jgi:hypothetical protein
VKSALSSGAGIPRDQVALEPRKKCYAARDEYFACLDSGEQEAKCSQLKRVRRFASSMRRACGSGACFMYRYVCRHAPWGRLCDCMAEYHNVCLPSWVSRDAFLVQGRCAWTSRRLFPPQVKYFDTMRVQKKSAGTRAAQHSFLHEATPP